MLGHNSLSEHYRLCFTMKYRFNYTQEEIEMMIPYEKDIFVEMITNQLKEEEEQRQNARS